MKARKLKYRILDAAKGWYGLLDWQAEPCYYETTGWVHSLWLAAFMWQRRLLPKRKGKDLDLLGYCFGVKRLGFLRLLGESDKGFRKRILKSIKKEP